MIELIAGAYLLIAGFVMGFGAYATTDEMLIEKPFQTVFWIIGLSITWPLGVLLTTVRCWWRWSFPTPDREGE